MHWTQRFCHAGYVPEQAGRPRSGVRGRLLAAGGLLGAALVLGSAMPAAAETGGRGAARASAGVPPAAKPVTRCMVTDPRLPEISGLVVVGDKMLAMNDGGDRVAVSLLAPPCGAAAGRSPGRDPPAAAPTCSPPASTPTTPKTWRLAGTARCGWPTPATTGT